MSTQTTEKPAKEKVTKEPKAPRASLWNLLQQMFAEGRSIEAITREVKERFPKSLFNTNTAFHYRYYHAKYNALAKKEGKAETASPSWPREPRVAKPKAEKAPKASGVTSVQQ